MKAEFRLAVVVDDDPDIGLAARLALRDMFERIESLSSPAELMPLLKGENPDAILLDLNFQRSATDGREGLAFLGQIIEQVHQPDLPNETSKAHQHEMFSGERLSNREGLNRLIFIEEHNGTGARGNISFRRHCRSFYLIRALKSQVPLKLSCRSSPIGILANDASKGASGSNHWTKQASRSDSIAEFQAIGDQTLDA